MEQLLTEIVITVVVDIRDAAAEELRRPPKMLLSHKTVILMSEP